MNTQQQSAINKDLRNSAQLAGWTLAWVASLALARFGPDHIWDQRDAFSWLAILLNIVIGIGWMAALARFLRGLDELQRKINQDALVIALGVGFVGGFAYAALHHADLTTSVNISLLPILMSVVYMAAIGVGNWRYR